MSHPKTRPSVTVPSTRVPRRSAGREWPRAPRRDPHTRLITQLLEYAGPDSSIIATSSRPWASATFVGARHVVLLRLGGAGHVARADRITDMLPDAEFAISGHVVADVCVDERLVCAVTPADEALMEAPGDTMETVLRLSILTVEDW